MRRLIATGSPFEQAYGYSRAVVDDNYVFVVGTTGYDYANMTMPEDVSAQTRNIWATIARTLEEAGSGIAHIVRATYYVCDRADLEPVLLVCGDVLRDVRPASSILVVAGLLRPEMKVEIEVTARVRGVSPVLP